MTRALSAAEKRVFARDGYAVLRRLVPRARAEAALREINRDLGERAAEEGRGGSEFLSYHLTCGPVLDLLHATPLRGVVDSLVGAGSVEPVSQAQIALRFPAADGAPALASAIHLDWFRNGRPEPADRFTLCAGVALSAVPRPEMGNLLVYPGSHALIAGGIAREGLDALRGGPAAAVAGLEAVPVTLGVGDVVLFHYQTAHGAEVNRSPHIRYMAYFRIYHADGWRDRSEEYFRRALTQPWLECPGMRGARAS